ncbi:MAG TPA: hypothetical protein VGS80_05615, partial [Ktedonobacterales bacterium]|nr:hypothetical protein [Ktedonobacterales bacterium]
MHEKRRRRPTIEREPEAGTTTTREDEWLWGWDPTPGIVSVWAERDGRALIWRREPGGGQLLR